MSSCDFLLFGGGASAALSYMFQCRFTTQNVLPCSITNVRKEPWMANEMANHKNGKYVIVF